MIEAPAVRTAVLKPIEEAPKDGSVVYYPVPLRWVPYNPRSKQYQRGQKGRWQHFKEYGWQNVDVDIDTFLEI